MDGVCVFGGTSGRVALCLAGVTTHTALRRLSSDWVTVVSYSMVLDYLSHRSLKTR